MEVAGWVGRKLMLRPVNGIDVNAFLYHLPQRAHIAQLLHSCDYLLNNEVDLSLRREPTDTKA